MTNKRKPDKLLGMTNKVYVGKLWKTRDKRGNKWQKGFITIGRKRFNVFVCEAVKPKITKFSEDFVIAIS